MESRSLSARESKVVLTLESEGREELGIRDIQHLAGVSRNHAYKIAHDLRRKGWIQAVGRGRFLLNPARHGPDAIPDTDPLRIGAHLTRPYYYAYATAANIHALTTQTSRIYYLVSPQRKQTKLSQPVEYHVVGVSPHKFFGFQELNRRGLMLTVSDVEKTVLDCLDRPDLCGGLPGFLQILHAARRRLDWPLLVRYLERFRNHSLAQRLGYLLDRASLKPKPPASALKGIRGLMGASYIQLEPASEYGPKGTYDHQWKIIDNVPRGILKSEVEVG